MPGASFDECLVDALQAGQRELAVLESVTARAIDAYRTAGATLARGGEQDYLSAEFANMRSRFAGRVTGHLTEQSNVLSSFNIVFFGRTGAGKSTLLSAFGELDGSAVSPGESDWTTTVESIPWRSCRLYDTPGINGWGGRRSRDELEATARRAVEVADVVLLCFDTQSQQATEFTKVADWVKHFGKPVIAVLNVRNPRWRHPARVPSQNARHNMSEPVAQHAENIRTELANIDLNDVPVVAISSRRALFARAATPYRGPAEQNFHDDRDKFGIDYLARWSNFAALEEVLSACIAAGGAQLRLKSLREGVRTRLHDEASSLDDLHTRLGERIDELDRVTRQYLEVLGYLEVAARTPYLHDDVWHADLLHLAESARRAPYRAPQDGTLVRQVRNLLKRHLAEARSKALRRFKDLEHEAFNKGKTIDADTFPRRVFRDAEVTDALQRVSAEASEFLERELSLAAVELRRSESTQFEKVSFDGGAGDTANRFANILRGGGAVGGVAAVAVPVLMSNPLGWAAAAVAVGIGAAATALQWVGEKVNRSATHNKARARAKAAHLGRKAVHDTLNAIETQFAAEASEAAWTAAAALVRPILIELVTLAALRVDVEALRNGLRTEATAIAQTTPFHLLDVTDQLLQSSAQDDVSERRSREILLGEDWCDHGDNYQLRSSAADLQLICQPHHDRDLAALRRIFQEMFSRPNAAAVYSWQQRVARAAESDEAFRPIATAALALPRPAVVVAGDYSTGKSSFIKRLIAEFDGNTPDSLHVRAGPSTDQVRRYPLECFDIVDTPGFQSRRTGDDELALTSVRDAALVIVVLHVNLLIGDTAALEAIINGTSTTVGKWPRILFIINRCDGLGVDPVDSPEEYFNRRHRKQAELAAALHSRGIAAPPAYIHGVAADPFVGVGSQPSVTAADYVAHRAWDGIAALVGVLRGWARNDLEPATVLAAFDVAETQLLTLREYTYRSVVTYREETSKHDSLLAAMGICLKDAMSLHQSLEHELADVLALPLAQAIARIRAVGVGDGQGLADAIYSWRSSESQAEIERFMQTATDKVNDWSATHLSAISREEAAAGFNANLNLSAEVSAGGSADTVKEVAGAAGWVANLGAQLGRALGNRQAALHIGHRFGHKFRPWGAIKAGKAVGRVGVVFGVAAVAIDATLWVKQVQTKRDWESIRDSAVEQVETECREAIKQLIVEPEGPWAYLDERTAQVRTLRDQYRDQQIAAQQEADRLQQRLVVTDELVLAAQALRKAERDE
ncbi:GTPase [Mycobacterium sp. P7213]|uniref:GTPase n=1 Tax=Mycobacterium sp. P7213 TaxID=2478465 RepID=UPI0013DDDC84|nr:GTPase [Mycobacterium sp. P7213]